MTADQPFKTPKRILPSNKRPTLGFLADSVWARVSMYPTAVWAAVTNAAQQLDANLICFTGGFLGKSPMDEFDKQRNVVYDLVSPDTVDGLIISSGSLSLFAPPEELRRFCNRYRPLPMVSIAVAIEGIPSVLVDNAAGLRDAIDHLIEDHGHRRIAFIRGQEQHVEANARYAAYAEALTTHGLALNPDLVAMGDFTAPSGAAAMRILLDERKLRPGDDFDAVVASTDTMALAAMDVLHERGLLVPYDVAVIGFDDSLEARVSSPPLTTVRQPIHEQCRRAVQMLLDLVEGSEVPDQAVLPTELVTRNTCGCQSQIVVQAIVGPSERLDMHAGRTISWTVDEALASTREGIVSMIVEAIPPHAGEATTVQTEMWAGQLLNGFAAAMRSQSPDAFLATLDRVLRQVAIAAQAAPSADMTQSIAAWQGAISILRHQTLSWLDDTEVQSWADNLWHQARLVIAEKAQQSQRYNELETEQQNGVLQHIGQEVVTTFDMETLMEVLGQEVPLLGIPSCYLSLFEGNERPPQMSRLVLAYDKTNAAYPKGRIKLADGGVLFPSQSLVPRELLPHERSFSMVLEPLTFRDIQLGVVLFEAGPRAGSIYEALRGQISSALRGGQLMRQEARRSRQLQTVAEVGTATSTILDTADLLQQIADLTKERFDLYHAHIYLLNQAGDTLELATRTGKIGQKMSAEGWRIPLADERSLVARVARSRQGEIINDVRAFTRYWLSNPYLPDTQSELAVPLIAENRVLGVLDVQSDQLGHFTKDDINIQATLAAQIAATLENARLFEQTNQAREEADRANQVKSQFLASMSHELRTPLNAILAFTKYMRQGVFGPVNDEQIDYLGKTIDSGEHLLTLINDILDITKIQTDMLKLYVEEGFDIPQEITSLAASAKKMLEEKPVELTVELDPDLPVVACDKRRVRQIFYNLISNAIKFTEEGTIKISARRQNGELMFTVADTGPGIAAEDQELIFQPFIQTETGIRHGGGTGLGLPISRELAVAHQGRLWVESEPGRGAKFILTLPIKVEAPKPE